MAALLAPHTDNIRAKSPDNLLGEVTQPNESRLRETTWLKALGSEP